MLGLPQRPPSAFPMPPRFKKPSRNTKQTFKPSMLESRCHHSYSCILVIPRRNTANDEDVSSTPERTPTTIVNPHGEFARRNGTDTDATTSKLAEEVPSPPSQSSHSVSSISHSKCGPSSTVSYSVLHQRPYRRWSSMAPPTRRMDQ